MLPSWRIRSDASRFVGDSRCLACSSDQLHARYHLPYGVLFQCENCGSATTVFLEPETLRMANLQWGAADEVRWRWLREPEERRTARARLHELMAWASHGRLLEIGPSRGEFLLEASTCGFRVSAADLFDTLASEVRDRCVDVYCGDFLHSAISQKFDVISAFHVLEHAPDPQLFVRRIRELLEPGGLLYLEVPNYDSVDRVACGRRWDMLFAYHATHFSRRGLLSVVESAGFERRMMRTCTDPSRYIMAPYFRVRVQAWQCVKRIMRSRSGTVRDSVVPRTHAVHSSRDALVRAFVQLELTALHALALPLAPLGPIDRWLGRGQVIRIIAQAV